MSFTDKRYSQLEARDNASDLYSAKSKIALLEAEIGRRDNLISELKELIEKDVNSIACSETTVIQSCSVNDVLDNYLFILGKIKRADEEGEKVKRNLDNFKGKK